jgi:hypothetical protein
LLLLPAAAACCSCLLVLPAAPACCSCLLLLPAAPAAALACCSCLLLLPAAPFSMLYGLGVYFFLSILQQAYAVKDFTFLARKVGTDIRKSFAQSNNALEYLAERYATTHPDESEWPLVMLEGFEMEMPYLRDLSGR